MKKQRSKAATGSLSSCLLRGFVCVSLLGNAAQKPEWVRECNAQDADLRAKLAEEEASLEATAVERNSVMVRCLRSVGWFARRLNFFGSRRTSGRFCSVVWRACSCQRR